MQHPLSLWHPTYWLATWFHSGLAPKAPGTFGSLAALPFAWVILQSFGMAGLLIAAIIAFFIGWLVSAHYVKATGREDPKEVVIDEVAGMWLILVLFQSYDIAIHLVAFAIFRLFDIYKPCPIGWVDRHVKGGLGIMLDDILAALYGALAGYVAAILGYVLLYLMLGDALWA